MFTSDQLDEEACEPRSAQVRAMRDEAERRLVIQEAAARRMDDALERYNDCFFDYHNALSAYWALTHWRRIVAGDVGGLSRVDGFSCGGDPP